MKVRVYTAAGFLEDEQKLVHALFDKGLETLHLYKPGFSAEAIYHWLDEVGHAYWPHIVLHVYESWVSASVGGYHLSRAFLARHSLGEMGPRILHGQTITVSAHQPYDWVQWKDAVHGVVVSPVFDSISKPGHFPAELLDTWTETFRQHPGKAEKIALGGITIDGLPALQAAGFDSVALSGWLWQEPLLAVSRFSEILATA